MDTFVMLRQSMPILIVTCAVFVLGVLVNIAGLCVWHEPLSSERHMEGCLDLFRWTRA